jgi:ribonuclease P protein component
MTENKRFTLSKDERLSWKRYTDRLFAEGKSFVAFPLRVVYIPITEEEPTLPTVSIMVSVSKKRFKRAVHRNRVKRLIRESYRLRKYNIIEPLDEKKTKLLVAFIHIDKELPSFAFLRKAMDKAMKTLNEKL